MPEQDWESAVSEAGNTPEATTEATPTTQETPVQEGESAPEKPVVVPAEKAPATEAPATEAPATDAPPATESAPAPATEEPKTIDARTKQILDALTKGGPEAEKVLKDYLDNKLKDYSTMPEADVLREHMKSVNPDWTDKDIELEMKQKYKAIPEKIDLDEIDEYDTEAIAQATEHNETVDYLLNVREREARIARQALEAQKENIQLPVISDNFQEPLSELEIAEMNQKWEAEVEAAIPNLSDVVYQVGGEEVTYKADAAEVQGIKAIMKDFNDVEYLTKRGWYNENGSMNIAKVAEDVRLLENHAKIVASMGTALANKGLVKATKDIKNLDLDAVNRTQTKPGAKSFADTVLDA